ncbi:hypothetical protein BXT84_01890 [Sulfobacillus thermotolerans]|uniref:Major facilitator superfamily (MFS) profile domain-containing protein n=1 Tax=Sulfobacillus thermotolerans TaxID=338644 RepID=A0ABN5GZS6_9FIRM|nr:hypothetical protein BXT84_01890 [Sulfobacillus thermotolerans]
MLLRRMKSKSIGPAGLLTIASLDQLAITMSQQGLSILSVAFKEYARLGVTQMGILFSTVALGAVIGMIPAGIALDRFGSRRVAWMAGSAILVVMGLLAMLLPRNFWALEALLSLVGFFLPALSLTGTTAITHVFDGSSREGVAIGIRQAATPLGGILAASLFPFLVKTWSLATVLWVIAVNAGGWTLAFAWALAPTNHSPRAAMPATQGLKSLVEVLRPLKYPLLISLLLSPGQYALLTYALLDLHDRWHVHMGIAGPIIALALLGGFLARIYMGKMMDKGAHSIPWLIALTSSVGVLSLVLWAIIPHGIPLVVIILIFFALGAGLDGWNALLTAWVAQKSSASQRGIALGLTGMAGFIGIVLFLPIFGLIIRWSDSYRPAWGLLALIYLVGIGLLAYAKRVSHKTI